MFTTFSTADAKQQVHDSIFHRLRREPPTDQYSQLYFPVGFLFIRGDRAGEGGALAEQVVASYGYWNDDSNKYFDMIFPGWGRDGDGPPVFDREAFLRVRNELERVSKWTYSGETDALLLDYVYSLSHSPGEFSFKHCIQLPVEVLIRAGSTPHLDAFMHEIVVAAREIWPRDDRSAVWALSDELGLKRGTHSLIEVFLEKPVVKDATKIYKDLQNFAVRDLRSDRVASAGAT